MMGLDKMFAGMIGLTPDQMQQLANNMMSDLSTAKTALEKIVDQNDEILAHLRGTQNDNENDHS